MEAKNGKVDRVLLIYQKLIDGELVNKTQEANRFNVNERSIQRDIDDIRCFLENDLKNRGSVDKIVYDRKQKSYKIENLVDMRKLTNGETLAICKILMDSRGLTKKEMGQIKDKLVKNCVSNPDKRILSELIDNEFYHYVELKHGKDLVDTIWEIGQAVKQNKYMEISYKRVNDKKIVKRKVKPVGIIFNEFYFYLTAFIDFENKEKYIDIINDSFPTIYRIDRIQKYKVLKENFYIPYRNKFEEGEFRKRIQFMFAGKLEKVRFKYVGNDIESIQDRLPTARIIEDKENYKIIEAEVFGKGIDMWLRSQGKRIEYVEKI